MKGVTSRKVLAVDFATFHARREAKLHGGVGFIDSFSTQWSDRRMMLVLTLKVFGVQGLLEGEPQGAKVLSQLHQYHAKAIFDVSRDDYCVDGAPPEVYKQ